MVMSKIDKDFLDALTPDEAASGILNASFYGNLDTVRYILTQTRGKFVATQDQKNHALRYACCGNHLDIIKFLLTSPKLIEKADVTFNENECLRWACKNQHVEVIRYLLTSEKISIHADIHANEDEFFKEACIDNKLKVLKYLVLEFKIDKTIFINSLCSNIKFKEVAQLFELRDLNDKLNKELINSTENKIKNKI